MPVDIDKNSEQPTTVRDVLTICTTSSNMTSIIHSIENLVSSTKPKALLLEVHASGTTHPVLNPLIEKCTKRGVPVFLLSDNIGQEHGIQKIVYDLQEKSAQAGAIPLRYVNMRNLVEVQNTIQLVIDQGLIGTNLKQAVIDRFGTVPDLNIWASGQVPTPDKWISLKDSAKIHWLWL